MSSPRTVPVSSENNHFQHAEVLKRNREKRNRYNEFLIEGVALINRAREYRWRIKSYLYSPRRGLSQWAKDILSQSEAELHLELAPALLEKLSEKEETSEILAVVEMAPHSIDRIPVTPNGIVAVFDRPSSPGNLGTSIRSCEAFRCDGMIVTGHAADIYHPQTVRGSMGAIFSMPVVRLPSQNELRQWLSEVEKSAGVRYRVIGTSGSAEKLVQECDYNGPLLIVMGNETVGMSRAYKEMCDETVKIEMGGANSSINVSCAASIVLYEIQRQRSLEGPAPSFAEATADEPAGPR